MDIFSACGGENISLAIFKDDQLAEHIVQHDHQYIGKDLHGKAPQCLRIVAAGNEDRRGAVCTADDGNGGRAIRDPRRCDVYRDISRQLNISYERLLPILKEENEAFYNLKCCLFDKYGIAYGKDDVQLLELKNTLRVPDISSIPKYKVSICLKMFEDLSYMEKIEFLQKIGKINVKIECLSVQAETIVE